MTGKTGRINTGTYSQNFCGDIMKIGVFTTTFVPHHFKLGISNVAYLTVRNLIKKYECDVDVYSLQLPGHKNTEKLKNLRIFRFPFRTAHQISMKMLTAKKNGFDIVHSFHYGYFPSYVGLRTAKKSGIPHAFTPAYHPPIYSKKMKLLATLYRMLQGSQILRKSDVTLPFNNNEKNQLEKYTKKSIIIPSPVDSSIFFPNKNPNDKITLGYVGPMLPWKGAHIAFQIFKQLEKERSDLNFLFIARGILENEIRKNASKRFIFLKDVPSDQLAEYLNSIDILVSPTYYESFGIILAEAGMCGTPVVSTNVGAVPETVGDGGLMVNYGDWNKMKEDITTLIDDEKLRNKLGKNAIKHTKAFKDDIVADRIFEIYKLLVD